MDSFAENYLFLSAFLTTVLSCILIFTFTMAPGAQLSRRLFGVYITLASCLEILRFFVVSGHIPQDSIWHGVTLPIHLISFTVIYFYICSLVDSDFNFTQVSRLHLLPLLAGLAWGLTRYFADTDEDWDTYVRASLIFLTSAIYLVMIHRQWSKVVLGAKNLNANLKEYRLPWLKFVLVVCYVSVVLSGLNLVTGLYAPFWFFSSLSFTVGVVGMTYFGLRYSKFFLQEAKLPSKSNLSEEELLRQKDKLLEYLNSEEPYLKPQFRLSDLADSMGLKSYLLSEIINRGLETNFYDLVNSMRVEKAKSMLLDETFGHMNLLGIAQDCGFNSKSSFNESFLRYAGQTPSRFRQQKSPG